MSQDTHDWRAAVEAQREQKNEYFGEDPRSPLPPDIQADFDGLDYYDVDADYRYELDLDRLDDPERVVAGTSTDGEQTYLA